MKSSKQLTKRGFSPVLNKHIDISDRKKKSSSNYQNITNKHKQFEPYHKTDKKRPSNYLKDLIKHPESVSKARMVTEPVDDRHITIISSSFVPSRSRGKIQHEHSSHKIRQTSIPKAEATCASCQRYSEELSHLKQEVKRIISEKSLWKNGQMNLEEVEAAWNVGPSRMKTKNMNKQSEQMLQDLKRHFHDLLRDIESLTEIDYPKMLDLKIFKYNPPLSSQKSNEEVEIKSLLGQLRSHYEGKVTAWDIEDEDEESDHVKAILRNLKSRLNHYLRQNLQLKAKQAVVENAGEMANESEQYLRLIIEDVLRTYGSKL